MKIKVLYIKPIDVIGFRKSKTFSTTEASIFPNPKTFYGAIFAAYLRKNKLSVDDIEKIIENKKLSIIGPFLSNAYGEIFFKIPTIVKQNEKTGKFLKAFVDWNFSFYVNNKKLQGIRYENMRDLKEPKRRYISLKELEKLKIGRLDLDNEICEIYKHESKIGVALKNRKSIDGMLYSLTYYRFEENAGFAFFVENDELNILNELDLIKIGLKGKLARLEIGEVETSVFDKINDNKKGILLLTPSYFENGLLPKQDGNIIAIANYKPESIGFWDLKNNRPGEMFKVVPAGSVYFIDGDLPNSYKENFTDKFQEFNFGRYIEIKL
ncbi:CRISPR-associated protein Cmr3 [Thermosipho melanesiensis]|uniref:CRISPR-associated protein, Cmr3 family n=2 Tax=Thermosipho melanesiensis TaxID=46541 RepID=A6LNK2_THEM4|nr:type III-B CRISPR module-associated protein Cmr3 [Thermosipho melanesiensis]ABR31503.1 CRISPR-associated protein, Cmr3 family [Thermosipho melanesiensis BI429]APT74556.1 CRISPR-associated protein Cmr3 [Thermosipho melanesiensis]OOC35471.1 CRISPR-associated protein Cmr3 [Thermosipho melanesiensis]OOC36508.1 CRISPR-associated protein Cmr3 [Thermosipho melanesiensis]OOC36831.1 CRISPR-associated protein Cmr3 [Thermosipho melanesiensis]